MITLLLSMQALHAEDDNKKVDIFPRVTKQFGQVVKVKVTFVAKPNTYWAQNIVKASCYAKIIEVNGNKLDKPVVME